MPTDSPLAARPSLLAARCHHEFLSGDRERGASYQARGRCTLGEVVGERVTAVVSGSGRMVYVVVVDWSEAGDGALFVSCDCPRFEQTLCKHVWATLLALDAAGLGALVPGSERLEVLVDEDLYYEIEEDDELSEDADFTVEDLWWNEVAGRAAAGGAPPPEPTDRRRDWRRQLDGLRSVLEESAETNRMGTAPLLRKREAWYLIEIEPSRASGKLVVGFYQRKERKDGTMGALKKLSISRDEIDSFTATEDRELLQLLLAAGVGGPEGLLLPYQAQSYGYAPRKGQAMLSAPLYELTLPRLCETGRCGWIDDRNSDLSAFMPLIWDEGAPYRLALRLEQAGPDAPAHLGGALRRSGETRALIEPVLLLADGLVIFPERLARLDVQDTFPWIITLREEGGLEIPANKMETLLAELGRMPVLPELVLPPELQLEEARGVPAPRIAFRTPRGAVRPGVLEARTTFDYAGREVEPGQSPASLIDLDERRLLVRDPQAETAALNRLHELGLRREGYDDEEWPFTLALRHFAPAVAALLMEGWTVEADRRRLRRPGAFRIQVSSGVDWFDLAGEVDFDGQSVPLPRLLAALRRGEQWVQLGDGEQGLLPKDWLQRYGPLAALVTDRAAEPVAEGVDELRVQPSQALLLDALLAGASPDVDVEVDQRFARLRERLASFAGVAPEAEPRGFQGSLRPYQQEGLGWLRFLRELGLGGCLADDMGLGKTVQVLAHLQRLRLGGPKGQRRPPHLIVAPRSLIYNWLDEAARFTPRLRLLDYTGHGRAAMRRSFGDYDGIVTTYGTLRRDVVELKETEFDIAILDEAQAIKNPDSQSAKACRLIHARHRLALTGTPVENHLGELFSIFEFLNPGMLGRLPKLKGIAGGKTVAEENLTVLARALRPVILRRTKEAVLTDLPEKTEQTLRCELSRDERKLYNELKDHYQASLTRRIAEVGLARSKIQVLEALLRLRQAACHPGLLDKERAGESSAKITTPARSPTPISTAAPANARSGSSASRTIPTAPSSSSASRPAAWVSTSPRPATSSCSTPGGTRPSKLRP